MPVNTPCSDYQTMSLKWSRIRDCASGRDAVLAAGPTYCPDVPGLTITENRNYRVRGNFYNAVSRTAQGLNGAVFQKPLDLKDVAEKDRSLLFDDMTLDDVSLESFARQVGYQVVLVSRFGVLVDMPLETPETRGKTTPYCVGYCAEDIVNWKTTKRNGEEELTMLILREQVKVSDPEDPFVDKDVEQYREIKLVGGQVAVQLWRQSDKDKSKFVQFGGKVIPTRRSEPLSFIPFYFVGSRTTSSHVEEPMLVDLADVNLAHWRNSVDYEFAMHLTALPTPWVSGLRSTAMPPDADSPQTAPSTPSLQLGPSVVWELDKDGQAGMLEFSGAGCSALKTAMDDKRKLMATLGARLLEESPAGSETALAVQMRHSGEASALVTVATTIERGLTHVVRTILWWVGTEATPEDVKATVLINKEFLSVKATPGEIAQALSLLQANKISYETFYHLLRKGGWSRDNVTPEQEIEAIKADLAKLPQPEPTPTPEPEPTPEPDDELEE